MMTIKSLTDIRFEKERLNYDIRLQEERMRYTIDSIKDHLGTSAKSNAWQIGKGIVSFVVLRGITKSKIVSGLLSWVISKIR